jgi:hypothetical protein
MYFDSSRTTNGPPFFGRIKPHFEEMMMMMMMSAKVIDQHTELEFCNLLAH